MLIDFPLIIIDESTDARLTEALTQAGYKIFCVHKSMNGIDDSEVIELAIDKGAFILTEDKDFGDELVYKNHRTMVHCFYDCQVLLLKRKSKCFFQL